MANPNEVLASVLENRMAHQGATIWLHCGCALSIYHRGGYLLRSNCAAFLGTRIHNKYYPGAKSEEEIWEILNDLQEGDLQ